MEYPEAQERAETEAAIMDGMFKGWYHTYSGYVDGVPTWSMLFLRRDPELVECLARAILTRILNDDMHDCMRVFAYRRGAVICAEIESPTL